MNPIKNLDYKGYYYEDIVKGLGDDAQTLLDSTWRIDKKSATRAEETQCIGSTLLKKGRILRRANENRGISK